MSAAAAPVPIEAIKRVTTKHCFTHWVRIHIFSRGVCCKFMDRAPGEFSITCLDGDYVYIELAPEAHLLDGNTRAIKPIKWTDFREARAQDDADLDGMTKKARLV